MRRRKYNRSTKMRCQRRHCKQRFVERFGFSPSDQEMQDMILQIQGGHAEHVETQSNRVTIFKVMIRELKVVVAYDKVRKQLATVMYDGDSPIFDIPVAPTPLAERICYACGDRPADSSGMCIRCEDLSGGRD